MQILARDKWRLKKDLASKCLIGVFCRKCGQEVACLFHNLFTINLHLVKIKTIAWSTLKKLFTNGHWKAVAFLMLTHRIYGSLEMSYWYDESLPRECWLSVQTLSICLSWLWTEIICGTNIRWWQMKEYYVLMSLLVKWFYRILGRKLGPGADSPN